MRLFTVHFFDRRLFAHLFIAFVLATIIGTLSHELAHFCMAKYLGHKASISYASMHWHPLVPNPDKLFVKQSNLYITLAGPLQTMITGSFGLLFILINRKALQTADKLSLGQWLTIFLALFWLRQPMNLIIRAYSHIFLGKSDLRNDDIWLAHSLELPSWSILVVTGLIGISVLAFVLFKIIPRNQRLVFVLSGLIGGITGYLLWIRILGKVLLP